MSEARPYPQIPLTPPPERAQPERRQTPTRDLRPNLGTSGLPLGRLFGIEIRLDWSWFIIFFLLTVSFSGYLRMVNPGLPEAAVWAGGAAAALGLFACVLIHELSHALVARRFGIATDNITLFVFGGVAHIVGEPPSPKAEFLIAGIGPLTSLALGGAFWLILAAGGQRLDPPLDDLLSYLANINVVLALFNLVPGFPLDGGRIARAWFWRRSGDLVEATERAARWGKAAAALLATYGIYLFLFRGDAGGVWFGLLAWFLYSAAERSLQSVLVRQALTGLTVAKVMSRGAVGVPADTTIAGLLDGFLARHRFHAFPVIRDGRVIGLISVKSLQRIPRDEWGTTTVEQAMVPLEELPTVTPDTPLTEALEAMSGEGAGRLPVLENGKPVGMVTRGDILRTMSLRLDIDEAMRRR